MGLKVIRIEHFDNYRWALRFVGSEQDFNAIRLRFKELGRPAIAWSPTYEWKRGKPGAWLITGRQLDRVIGCFDNLEGTHTARREHTNVVHLCAFWITGTQGDRTPHMELEPV